MLGHRRSLPVATLAAAVMVAAASAVPRAQIRYDAVQPSHLARVSKTNCALDKTLPLLPPSVVASPQGTWTAIVDETDPVKVPYDKAQACVKLSGHGVNRSVTVGDFRTLRVTWVNERLLYVFTDVGHAASVGQLLDVESGTFIYAQTEYYPQPQAGPPSIRPSDDVVIGAARRAIVNTLDPKLPSTAFDGWLRGVVGQAAAMTWGVNDCGEQTGNPALDRGRDFPMCVEVHVPLGSKRDLYVSLLMGTFAKGLGSGRPAFHHAVLNTPDGKSHDVRALSELPALLGSKQVSRRIP